MSSKQCEKISSKVGHSKIRKPMSGIVGKGLIGNLRSRLEIVKTGSCASHSNEDDSWTCDGSVRTVSLGGLRRTDYQILTY